MSCFRISFETSNIKGKSNPWKKRGVQTSRCSCLTETRHSRVSTARHSPFCVCGQQRGVACLSGPQRYPPLWSPPRAQDATMRLWRLIKRGLLVFNCSRVCDCLKRPLCLLSFLFRTKVQTVPRHSPRRPDSVLQKKESILVAVTRQTLPFSLTG